MFRTISVLGLGLVLTLAMATLGGSVTLDSAGTGPSMPYDCSSVKLTAAKSSPGPTFGYRFEGVCINKKTFPPTPMPVKVSALYKAGLYEALENVKLTGPGGGTMATVMRCTGDPFVTNTPCTVKAHSNNTKFPLTTASFPLTRGLTTAAQAKALWKKGSPPPPPPPPPPPKK